MEYLEAQKYVDPRGQTYSGKIGTAAIGVVAPDNHRLEVGGMARKSDWIHTVEVVEAHAFEEGISYTID
ncbi:hypothetical protein V6N13_039277 [Hibiscus sabdariffa]